MAKPVYSREGPGPTEYYASLGGDHIPLEGSLKDKFHDIDDKVHFDEYRCQLWSSDTKNFVLDFGNEDAWCATNLRKDELTLLLSRPVCWGVSTRDDSICGLTLRSEQNVSVPGGCTLFILHTKLIDTPRLTPAAIFGPPRNRKILSGCADTTNSQTSGLTMPGNHHVLWRLAASTGHDVHGASPSYSDT